MVLNTLCKNKTVVTYCCCLFKLNLDFAGYICFTTETIP